MPNWQNDYRRCDNCRSEYRPQREAQSYCGRDCRRAVAYGRERFKNGTKGRRKRRLEASDKLPGTLVAGSFRNGDFSSIETGSCRPTDWIEKLIFITASLVKSNCCFWSWGVQSTAYVGDDIAPEN